MARISFAARRQARFMLVQALYQWHLTEATRQEIVDQFSEQPQFAKADGVYFSECLSAIVEQVDALDRQFEAFLDRKLVELDPIELTILRLATYELLHRLELPYRVAINEALELTKIFGATDSFKYVNGVLDQVAKTVRQTERLAEAKLTC
jgi:N utilization substance protein B